MASFAICMANSRVGEITSSEIPDPRPRFLLIMVCTAGSKNAIVFPVPVFACAKTSMRCARSSTRVAAWTGIMWSNLRSWVRVLRRMGWRRLSLARSANRGVSRGTDMERGGVATRRGGAGAANEWPSRGVGLVLFEKGRFPPLGCRLLAGCLLVSWVMMVVIPKCRGIMCRKRSDLGSVVRENIEKEKKETRRRQ